MSKSDIDTLLEQAVRRAEADKRPADWEPAKSIDEVIERARAEIKATFSKKTEKTVRASRRTPRN